MANRTYLLLLDAPDIDLFSDENEEKVDYLADGPYFLPLFWLALFRPADIVRCDQPDEETGELLRSEYAVAPTTIAAAQLEQALPFLNRLFAKEGPVDEYVSLLKQAMTEAHRPYVQLQIDEVAWMDDPEAYYDRFREALTDIVTGNAGPEAKARWKWFAGIEGDRPFPPARLYVDPELQKRPDADPQDDDLHSRLLGNQYLDLSVPWE